MRTDTVYSGGKRVLEHTSDCHLDHVHYPDRYTTRGTNILVVTLACTRTGALLATVSGTDIKGQLTMEFRRAESRVPTDGENLKGVLALHVDDGGYCTEDGFVWPCRTRRAADPSEATRDRLAGRLEGLVATWRDRIVDSEAQLVVDTTGACLAELEAAMIE